MAFSIRRAFPWLTKTPSFLSQKQAQSADQLRHPESEMNQLVLTDRQLELVSVASKEGAHHREALEDWSDLSWTSRHIFPRSCLVEVPPVITQKWFRKSQGCL